MKSPLFLIMTVSILLCLSVFKAEAYQIKNVKTTVTPDDRIMIEYDLDAGNLCTITLDVSLDSASGFPIKPLSLSQDVGEGIKPGMGKRILWDVFTDMKRLSGDLAVKVSAVPDSKNPVSFSPTGMQPVAGITLVFIPAGAFRMGSDWEKDPNNPDRDKGRFIREQPVHTVTISSFQMGAYEVTQGQYKAVMSVNPSYFKGDNLPVESVSWWDAIKFCNRLSDKAGLERCYNEINGECCFTKNGFRLPTEAEWEYACRAGTTTNYYTGDSENDLDRAGWYFGNSGDRNVVTIRWNIDTLKDNNSRTHPVGQKAPNAWGLYDMHGNVKEWCNDRYGNYSSGGSINPTGIQHGVNRVWRGGGWYYFASGCRSVFRMGCNPYSRDTDIGFRVVRR
jgi:formylglycine-generating enzyme